MFMSFSHPWCIGYIVSFILTFPTTSTQGLFNLKRLPYISYLLVFSNTYILCSLQVYIEVISLCILVNCTVYISEYLSGNKALDIGNLDEKKTTYTTDIYWRNTGWNSRINSFSDLRETARYWPFHCTST